MAHSLVDPLFDQFFDAAKFCFWYVPLHPYRLFVRPVTRYEYVIGRVVYYFVLSSQILLLFLYSMFLIDSIAHDGDFLITAATTVWFVLAIMAYQSVYFCSNSGEKIVNLLEEMHDEFPKTIDEKVRVDAEGITREWRAKMKVQTNVFLLAVIGMVITPIVFSAVNYISDGVWENQLPLNIWTPFDPLVMPVYPIIYLVEIWFFLVNTFVIVGIEAMLGAITMLICMQFKSVALTFRSIEFGDYSKDILAMASAIKQHNRVLRISQKTRDIFSVTLFVSYAISSIVICIFLFLIINEKHLYANLQYIANLICYLVYCAVFGYYGNEIIEHSTAVADAVYESNWMAADVRIQKLIIIVMRRANTPQILTGLDFFTASFPTLSKILSTSYSYFTLLRTSYEPPQ